MENDDGVSLESGERSPLLDKSQSSRHFEDNDSEEIDQISEPQSVTSISKAPPIILAFSFLEGIAFNGIGINLVLYLGSVLHWPISSSAANVSFWGGTTYFTPLLGGLLADTYLGNYRTIVISIILYLLGLVIVTLSATIPSLTPPS
ncbi:protein NRT1/ PTR FAMILY 5.6-like [Zingiber officinale]|uniref:protein NRT1/ PTR FAMILY 5.6-like n=1 Tax=Zingiber officinale TaxID=94328 RepID=UPI001C4BEB9A|nr:protein NRT1/ PTR FAMILY 5.6-like [Zingiber officinale]